ncbi:MAG TPA: amino acid permease [Pseudobdellovibrionaceae bacterium]|jgi:APA family basic amino acid/polyamine antiporter
MKDKSQELQRTLGLLPSASLVVGTIIGTGVFLKAAIMSQLVGSSFWVLVAWAVAGVLSLAGALTYAEIGILFPRAGGEYVYLREAYGNLTAFLYGWQRFLISNTGTIAAYAVGAATFAAPLFDLSWCGGVKGFSILLIAIFSGLNCLNVTFGGRLQSVMTIIKVMMIFFIVIGILFLSPTSSFSYISAGGGAFPGFSAFGSAILAALWAYDGWNNLPMVAGEIKNPSRNIPLSLGLGVFFIVAIYVLIHFCYFMAMPFSEVISANSNIHPDALPVAAKAAQSFLGSTGVWFLGIAMIFSAVGAMNGSILTSARIPYAMAIDGLFHRSLATLHKKSKSPYVSVLTQGMIAAVLALSGTFDQLTDYVVFASWIFYALVASSVFVFRRKHPEMARPYKTLGYPYLPVLFLISALLLLINTVWTMPKESSIGLALILLGVPFYYFMERAPVSSSPVVSNELPKP